MFYAFNLLFFSVIEFTVCLCLFRAILIYSIYPDSCALAAIRTMLEAFCLQADHACVCNHVLHVGYHYIL